MGGSSVCSAAALPSTWERCAHVSQLLLQCWRPARSLASLPIYKLQNLMKLGHNKRDELLDTGAKTPGVQYGHHVLLLCSSLHHLLRAAVPLQQVLAVATRMASVHQWQHCQLCELW